MEWLILEVAATSFTGHDRQIFELDEFRFFIRLFHGDTSLRLFSQGRQRRASAGGTYIPPAHCLTSVSLLRLRNLSSRIASTGHRRKIFELDEFGLFVRLFHGDTSFAVRFMRSWTGTVTFGRSLPKPAYRP